MTTLLRWTAGVAVVNDSVLVKVHEAMRLSNLALKSSADSAYSVPLFAADHSAAALDLQ